MRDMGDMFKRGGYATAIFGKWHLGSEPQSLPTAHGFDEFYGIPPDIYWDAATYVDTMELTYSNPAPAGEQLARGPQIYEPVPAGPPRAVKPFTPEVRMEIDNELVAKSIDFMKRLTAAGREAIALATHLRDELGISEISTARPVQAALTSAATFAAGAALPLLVVFISPQSALIPAVLRCLIGFSRRVRCGRSAPWGR